MIACDTSFLFSLYGNDVHSLKAVEWVSKNPYPLHLNSFIQFEFGNALRFSEFRKAIAAGMATQYWAGYEAALAQGRLTFVTSNLADVMDEAKQLSAKHTLSGGHRSFDILHIASALIMKSTHFLTFDGNQKKLAEVEGLEVPV